MTDQSEVEVLAQTAEWLSRLADTIERVTDKLADKIARLEVEQGEIRDGMLALSNRIEAVTRDRADANARLQSAQTGTFKPGE